MLRFSPDRIPENDVVSPVSQPYTASRARAWTWMTCINLFGSYFTLYNDLCDAQLSEVLMEKVQARLEREWQASLAWVSSTSSAFPN